MSVVQRPSGALACPSWFFCEQISSPTCLIISGIRTDLGWPPAGFLMRADLVSSTRLQISLTVTSFQFFSHYFALITQYPSPCSRNVWILTLSSIETLYIYIYVQGLGPTGIVKHAEARFVAFDFHRQWCQSVSELDEMTTSYHFATRHCVVCWHPGYRRAYVRWDDPNYVPVTQWKQQR